MVNDQDFFSALDKREEAQAKVKYDFDWNRKPDSILLNGTNELVQRKKKNSKNGPWDQKGIIVSKRPNGNSYIIDIGGQEFLQSRLFLRPVLDISENDSAGGGTLDFGWASKLNRGTYSAVFFNVT